MVWPPWLSVIGFYYFVQCYVTVLSKWHLRVTSAIISNMLPDRPCVRNTPGTGSTHKQLLDSGVALAPFTSAVSIIVSMIDRMLARVAGLSAFMPAAQRTIL
jgi:hypothetical protein